MGFFDFLFGRKRNRTKDIKESSENKTLRTEEIANPGNEFLKEAGLKYQQGDFAKALELIRKAQQYGKEPNSAMLGVIKSKLGMDSQNEQEKISIINKTILNKEFLTFYYPSVNSQYYDLVSEIVPGKIIEDASLVDSKGKYYIISDMKKVKSFVKSYYQDKPN